MLLKDKFFSITKEERTNDCSSIFFVKLLEDCDCYKGHFPGNPVSPGVCNVEMIRECAELLTGKDLKIESIKLCRLTEIASPQKSPEVKVDVTLSKSEDGKTYGITASIADDNVSYMTLKGTLVCEG